MQRPIVAIHFLTCTLLAIGQIAGQEPKPRFFTDSSGKFRIRATIVNLDETTVELRKLDGQVVTVPIERLSQRDQAFLKEAYARYRKIAGDFLIGTKVEIFSSGGWHPGVVLQVQPGQYFVDFDKYSDTWNKWVTADQLRLAKAKEVDAPKANAPDISQTPEAMPRLPGGNEQSEAQVPTPPDIPDPQLPELVLNGDRMPTLSPGSIQGRRFLYATGKPIWDIQPAIASGTRLSVASFRLLADRTYSPERFLPSLRQHYALVTRANEVYGLNLTTGSVMWRLDSLVERGMRALAISDDGRRVAFALEDGGQPLGVRVYDIDELTATITWQWQPIPTTNAMTNIKQAVWLTGERLGILDANEFSVWNPVRKKVAAVMSCSKDAVMKPAPDGSQIAFLTSYRLALFRTNGMKMTALTSHLGWDHKYLSFQPNGSSILVSGGKEIAQVSTTTGEVRKLEVGKSLAGMRVDWIDNQYVLAGQERVYDLKAKMPVWTIRSAQGKVSKGFVDVLGDKLVIADGVRSRLLLRDLGDVVDQAKIAQGPESLTVVFPGVKIATKVTGTGADEFREVVEQQLQEIIRRNGWVHDPSSSVVMQANIDRRTEKVTYETKGIIGFGAGSEDVTVSFANFRLRIVRDSKTVYLRGWTSLVQTITRVPRNQTLAEYVTEKSRPDPTQFGAQKVPATIRLDHEEGGFGTTEIWTID